MSDYHLGITELFMMRAQELTELKQSSCHISVLSYRSDVAIDVAASHVY